MEPYYILILNWFLSLGKIVVFVNSDELGSSFIEMINLKITNIIIVCTHRHPEISLVVAFNIELLKSDKDATIYECSLTLMLRNLTYFKEAVEISIKLYLS